MVPKVSPQTKISATLASGLAAAVVISSKACLARYDCEAKDSCTGSGFCSFSNRVAVSASTAYNLTISSEALADTLRSVCAPGERLQYDTLAELVQCVPYFSFPNAMDTETMKPTSTVPHQRACGNWIDAKVIPFGGQPEQRSTHDHANWLQVLKNAENASTLSPRNANGAMSKFRAECRRTVDSGVAAIRISGGLAYQTLRTVVEAASTRTEFLRAVGHLTGRYCQTGVYVGTFLGEDGQYYMIVLNAWLFSSGVMQEVLALFDEPTSVQRDAEEANTAINSIAAAYQAPVLSDADIMAMLKGATDSSTGIYRVHSVESNSLNALMDYYTTEPEKASAYLKATAAMCVFSLMANVESRDGILASELTNIQDAHPRAAALGRLAGEGKRDVDEYDILKSSEITLATANWPSSGDADVDCLGLMRILYADSVDEARFQATVANSLYARLEGIIAQTRVGVSTAVLSEPLSSTLSDPQLVATDVETAGIRIAGAPRGSWAGIARPLAEATIASDDGVFTMALKQAHAVFLDRVDSLVIQAADPCDHPPLFSGLTTVAANAYVYTGINCIQYLLGMAHRPWLDAQYDDESIASRGVAIFAHELTHLVMNTDYQFPAFEDLLVLYQDTTYNEAIADVGAALGMIATGLVTRDRFIDHFCSLWCSRLPFGWTANPSSTHPEFNQRCDFLDETIRRYI